MNNYTIGRCANCDERIPYERASKGKLFCSDICRDRASIVRYARGAIQDGRYEREELVRQAVKIKLGFAIGEKGYPETERTLSKQIRDAVFKRDKGKCQICGNDGTTIDHIRDSSPDLDNLQVLCQSCHNKKTFAGMKPANPQQIALLRSLWERINSPMPHRLCDDETHWNGMWKKLSIELKQWSQTVSWQNEDEYRNVTVLTHEEQATLDPHYNYESYETWLQENSFEDSDYFHELMQRDD